MAWGPGEVFGETIAQPESLNTLRQVAICRGGFGRAQKVRVNYGLPRGALNSAVECHLHTVEVAGSNPAAPTINIAESMIYGAGIGAYIGAIWDRREQFLGVHDRKTSHGSNPLAFSSSLTSQRFRYREARRQPEVRSAESCCSRSNPSQRYRVCRLKQTLRPHPTRAQTPRLYSESPLPIHSRALLSLS